MRVLAFLAVAAALNVHAQAEPRTYAILSLLGDRMTLVVHVPTAGTNMGSERRSVITLTTPVLDHATILAAESGVKSVLPGAQPVLLVVRDPAIYEAQSSVSDPDVSAASLMPTLAPILAGAHVTHALVFTKVRHEAQIALRHSVTGSGRLEGLGFYVDNNRALEMPETGERFAGMVAPYAYFRISLVEVASGRVIAERPVYGATAIAAHSAVSPWEELTPEQKVDALRSLLKREIAKAVPPLLSGAP